MTTPVEAPSSFRRDAMLTHLPVSILALPHAIHCIDTLLITPDEAVMVATTTRHLDWLKNLIEGYSCNVQNALLVAGANGDVSVLKILLNKPSLQLHEAAIVAAENGHREAAELLLLSTSTREEQIPTAWKVIEAGATNGHVDVVELAANYAEEKRNSLSPEAEQEGNALACAIAAGHAEVVRFLIFPCVFQWNLADALDEAAAIGNEHICQLIYEAISDRVGGEYVFEDYEYDDMMTYIAGRIHATKYLYNHGHNSVELVCGTFTTIVLSGNMETTQFFLDTGKVSQKAFDRGFKHVVQYGWIEIMRYLYENRPASAMAFVKGVKRAEDRRAEYCAKAVGKFCSVETGLLSADQVTAVFETAILKNVAGIVRELIGNPFISGDIVVKAFKNAARRGQVEVVEAMLKSPAISAEVIKEVFWGAVQNEHDGIIELLAPLN